jgi:erythromycin esterase
MPLGWFRVGTSATQYDIGRDVGAGRNGTVAAYFVSRDPGDADFTGIGQTIDAVQFRGQRIRWAGWVRAQRVSGGAALWARVDGAGRTLALDNMFDRQVTGTTDWVRMHVVLDVPSDAAIIVVGAIMRGRGDMLVDDLGLDVVDASVPTTDLLVGVPRDVLPAAPPGTSTERRLVNLGFEGGGEATEAAMAWLRSAVHPLRATVPDDDDSDMAPLGAMLGDATVIGMGEGTHGTREFFDLKHRAFRYLVRQRGVTHFAIEGAWAEANEIDHFVRTGEGDPTRLLSKLGFWTWNTVEVRELILWMREWNRTAPVGRQVRFLGFDMQRIALPADTLAAFVATAMPTLRDSATAWLACLGPFRGLNGQSPRPASEYAARSAAERVRCRTGLDRLAMAVDAYQGPESAERLARIRQSAQILRQWETVAAETSPMRGNALRDSAMAVNVQWLLTKAPAGTRIMLWAHNEHVAVREGWMGRALRDRFGDAYRSVALLFGQGSFNAVLLPSGGLRPLASASVRTGSIESYLQRAGALIALFDARRLLAADAEVAAVFRGPLFMRTIGSGYDPAQEQASFVVRDLPDHFDHLLFVQSATPTRLLPFVPF